MNLNFRQLLKELLKRGEEPRYVVKNVGKPPKAKAFKKRGIGWTRRDKHLSKVRRKMTKASRRASRRKK